MTRKLISNFQRSAIENEQYAINRENGIRWAHFTYINMAGMAACAAAEAFPLIAKWKIFIVPKWLKLSRNRCTGISSLAWHRGSLHRRRRARLSSSAPEREALRRHAAREVATRGDTRTAVATIVIEIEGGHLLPKPLVAAVHCLINEAARQAAANALRP